MNKVRGLQSLLGRVLSFTESKIEAQQNKIGISKQASFLLEVSNRYIGAFKTKIPSRAETIHHL